MYGKYSTDHKLAERTVRNPIPKELKDKGKECLGTRDGIFESRGHCISIRHQQLGELTAF